MDNLPDSLSETKKEFQRLSIIWKEETKYLSSLDTIFSHDAYQKILEIGPEAIPFILEDLRDNGGFWFDALARLTGDHPTSPKDAGRIDKISESWLAYGREKHYI